MFAVVLMERRADVFLATKFGNLGGSADNTLASVLDTCATAMGFQHEVSAQKPTREPNVEQEKPWPDAAVL